MKRKKPKPRNPEFIRKAPMIIPAKKGNKSYKRRDFKAKKLMLELDDNQEKLYK